ncbi:hypothetical protein ABZX75_11515 [Streptomyces sp. NPDC003038]|uniref:hypothetical protein n=1 Tax=unclassified Streptomyces TaxID=2593676 RepID=UPI0033BFAD49
MTTWNGAEVSGGGSDYSDHYAEKAAAREAERREVEEYRQALADSREWETEYQANLKYQRENPRPHVPDADDPEFYARIAEDLNWAASREKYVTRAEGEELAARIFRRR